MLKFPYRKNNCIAICRKKWYNYRIQIRQLNTARSCQSLITRARNQTPNGGFRPACEVKARTFYSRTTFCRPGARGRSPLREIFHRVFGITKKYRPTMHPKCAAALADKDGKRNWCLKEERKLPRASGRIYTKKEAAEMRSRIVFCTSAFGIRPLAAFFLWAPIIRVRPCSVE